MISRVGRTAGPEVMGAGTPEPGSAKTPVDAAQGPQRGSFHDVVSRLSHEIDRGEVLVGRAVSGGHSGLDAGQLIALQAGIYRYSEAVDLAAKLVDRAGSAVKTTLQGSGS